MSWSELEGPRIAYRLDYCGQRARFVLDGGPAEVIGPYDEPSFLGALPDSYARKIREQLAEMRRFALEHPELLRAEP